MTLASEHLQSDLLQCIMQQLPEEQGRATAAAARLSLQSQQRLHTSTIVMTADRPPRSTRIVVSAHRRSGPATPPTPSPSTTSRVSLNGDSSGVGRYLPPSKAMPKSMWTVSAVRASSKMLLRWRSPRPMM